VRQAPEHRSVTKNTGFRLDLLATIPEVPGAISQGRTPEEARTNVIDALRVVLTPTSNWPASASTRTPNRSS
jgi:hypothetical protein